MEFLPHLNYIFILIFCQYLLRNFLEYNGHGNFFLFVSPDGVGGIGGGAVPSYLTIVPLSFGIPNAVDGFRKLS